LRDIGKILLTLTYSTSTWHPRWRWLCWNFSENIFDTRKLESCVMVYGIVYMILSRAVLIQYRLVTNTTLG